MQQSIFDMIYQQKKITKPIRLIEFFAGYGSQALALKYLGVPFEHWKICEWAIKSIQAYKDIHFSCENFNYSNTMTKEQLINQLYNLGISSNYNEPMTKQQIERLSEQQLRTIWNNIVTTHNLVNIQQVKGKDLEIVDTDKYEYIMTYSFPCQDLSLAGKGKGMSDTSTRSGLLWEVERILTECYDLGTLPQILLMENVPQVHGIENVDDFNKWQLRLEELGYKNYFQDLIATDYGIPQTRNRCFMISILGDYNYTFPKPIPLKLKLKDLLEDNVDEKYYLSSKMIKYISSNNEKWTGNNQEALINKTYASTINTNEGSRRCDASNYVSDNVGENYNLKDNLELKNSDKLSIIPKVLGGIGEQDSNNNAQWKQQNRIYDNNVSITVTTCCNPNYVDKDLKIRKLTPKECGRLMGVKDEDIDKLNLSDSAKYHIFGDSIVVNILIAIFKELL